MKNINVSFLTSINCNFEFNVWRKKHNHTENSIEDFIMDSIYHSSIQYRNSDVSLKYPVSNYFNRRTSINDQVKIPVRMLIHNEVRKTTPPWKHTAYRIEVEGVPKWIFKKVKK